MSITATAPAGSLPSVPINRGNSFAGIGASAPAPEAKPADVAVEPDIELEDESQAGEEGQPGESIEPSLVAEAISNYGFDKEEAEQLGDALPAVLARMDRQAAQLMRDQLKGERQEHREVEPQPKTEERRETQPQPAASPFVELPKFELAIDREIHDEGTLKAFDSLSEQINKDRETINQQTATMRQMAQLLIETHGKAKQVDEQFQATSVSAFEKTWDGIFAGLGDEYADSFGKAPLRDLPPDSPLVIERQKLVEEAQLLKAADKHRGRSARDDSEYARRALAYLKSEKVATAARKDVEKKLNERRGSAVARPSGRTAKKASGDERALDNITKKLAAMGLAAH